MATKLTQTIVNGATSEQEAGSQLYDSEVPGLRVVVGKTGCSFKFVGRINDGTDRYVSVIIGRTDDLSLRSARERATELLRQPCPPPGPRTNGRNASGSARPVSTRRGTGASRLPSSCATLPP